MLRVPSISAGRIQEIVRGPTFRGSQLDGAPTVLSRATRPCDEIDSIEQCRNDRDVDACGEKAVLSPIPAESPSNER